MQTLEMINTDTQYYNEHIKPLMTTVASGNSSLDFSENTLESKVLKILTRWLNPENGLTNGIQARDYQIRVIVKAVKAIILDGHRTVLVTSPTGSGKTVMLLLIAAILYELSSDPLQLPEEPLDRFIWTCMRHALLEQADREMQAKFPGIYESFSFLSTFAVEVPDELVNTPVLIEDEGQHSASITSTAKYARIKPSVHIATTATPFRTDSMKLTFSKVIQDAGLRQLVDQGYLSPYHQYMMKTHDWSAEAVAETFIKDQEKWGKSVVFFLTLEECFNFKRLMDDAGVTCAVVRGGQFKEQERIIEEFKGGKYQVIANVAVLTEGFDCPELETVFIRHGSKAPTTQMAGRGFRILPGIIDECKNAAEREEAIARSDKPYVNIVQNLKTRFPVSSLVSPEKSFKQESDGDWTEVQSRTHNVDKHAQKMRLMMARVPETKLPPIIMKAKGKQEFYRNLEEQRDAAERAQD